jgi:hypothetical protein
MAELMTVEEAANYLRVTEKTIYYTHWYFIISSDVAKYYLVTIEQLSDVRRFVLFIKLAI